MGRQRGLVLEPVERRRRRVGNQQVRQPRWQQHTEPCALVHPQPVPDPRLRPRHRIHQIGVGTKQVGCRDVDRQRLDPVQQIVLCCACVGGHREIVLVRDLLRPRHRVQVPVLAAMRNHRDRNLGVLRTLQVLTRLRRVGSAQRVGGLLDHRDRRRDVRDIRGRRNVHTATVSGEPRQRVPHRAGHRREVRHRIDRLQRSTQTTRRRQRHARQAPECRSG